MGHDHALNRTLAGWDLARKSPHGNLKDTLTPFLISLRLCTKSIHVTCTTYRSLDGAREEWVIHAQLVIFQHLCVK